MDYYFHAEARDFSYTHETNETFVQSERFRLHNHPHHFEILLFLGGTADFLVEGNAYPLQPFDIVIAQNFEMHCMKHKDFQFYDRKVIDISNSFFANNDCTFYRSFLTGRPLGRYNKIPAETVLRQGIDCIFSRMESYLKDKEDCGTAAKGALLELLYILRQTGKKELGCRGKERQMNDILHYVNEHLTEKIILDSVASHFFLSKGHFCRVFKENTGYTFNQYLTYKRMLKAQELFEEGFNWQEASSCAGFGDYSNFYKIYRRMYGKSPSQKNR